MDDVIETVKGDRNNVPLDKSNEQNNLDEIKRQLDENSEALNKSMVDKFSAIIDVSFQANVLWHLEKDTIPVLHPNQEIQVDDRRRQVKRENGI